jgi:hypothetical protein
MSSAAVGGQGRVFETRSVVLAAGHMQDFDEEQWRSAVVIVERGRIELLCHAGGRRVFDEGDLLWFEGLSLRALHNPGPGPVVLVAYRRRPLDTGRTTH